MSAVYYLAAIAVGLAIGLGVWQFKPAPSQAEELHERLARVHAATMLSQDIDEIEMQKSFSERVLLPVANSIGRILARRTKESQLADLRVKIARAGSNKRPEMLLTLQVITPIVFAAGSVGISMLMKWEPPLSIALPVMFAVIGYKQPVSSLEGKAKKRATEIRMTLPGALDLLCVAMEAGLSLDAAMTRLCEGPDSVLNQEFSKVLGEIHLGRPRGEALLAMAERNEVDEVTSFVRSLVQAEPLGVSIASVLSVQAEELRRLRRQRAEEAGHRAPVLMLLPMMGCIFPCIFIMLLGPAVVKIVTGQ